MEAETSKEKVEFSASRLPITCFLQMLSKRVGVTFKIVDNTIIIAAKEKEKRPGNSYILMVKEGVRTRFRSLASECRKLV